MNHYEIVAHAKAGGFVRWTLSGCVEKLSYRRGVWATGPGTVLHRIITSTSRIHNCIPIDGRTPVAVGTLLYPNVSPSLRRFYP